MVWVCGAWDKADPTAGEVYRASSKIVSACWGDEAEEAGFSQKLRMDMLKDMLRWIFAHCEYSPA